MRARARLGIDARHGGDDNDSAVLSSCDRARDDVTIAVVRRTGEAMSLDPSCESWQQPPIGDYGFLSDCQSAALVDRGGSIDWWCVPRFDSPSVFGRLLDPAAGHWLIAPVGSCRVRRAYVGDSVVLATTFTTETGEVTLTDAAALRPGARGHDIGHDSPHVLLRRLSGVRGDVEVEIDFAPRMEYGRTCPHLSLIEGGVVARGGPTQLTLMGPVEFACADGHARARLIVHAGEPVEFAATFRRVFGTRSSRQPRPAPTIDDTQAGWQSWADLHHSYAGRHVELVRRSSIVLQGLTFQPSGAIVAAATTSLPETMGADLNWDYRYAWLRDFSFTIRSLWIAACPAEPARLLDWFVNAAGVVGNELFQIMYGVDGERDLTEHTLDHLRGYHDSGPVRIGNQAWTQTQLDVLGEVVDAIHVLRDEIGEFDQQLQTLVTVLADRAASQWQEPDAGMWEARDKARHYVSSKVMCWVALDRAIDLADRLGPGIDLERWTTARDELRATIIARAWSETQGAYAGAFGSDDLDASVLMMPLVGFLAADDPRMRATITAIERLLGDGEVVRRWRDDASGFVICAFWLSECLALAGDIERAEHWFDAGVTCANDLGLMSEEISRDRGALLGNFPQAFSHIGLINAAWRLSSISTT
jgi:GH15 family glucan-1,4-alpha-glucosidase